MFKPLSETEEFIPKVDLHCEIFRYGLPDQLSFVI